MNSEDISKIFKALSHPARLKIVYSLINGCDCHVTKIAQNLKLRQPKVSQHILALKNFGLVEGIRAGNEICYKVKNNMTKKIIELMEIKKS